MSDQEWLQETEDVIALYEDAIGAAASTLLIALEDLIERAGQATMLSLSLKLFTLEEQ